jgi:protein gp37
MAEPAALRKPSKIFVCSMGDLFGRGVPDIWTEQVLAEIRLNPQHTFQLLTKCPGQLPRWSPFPDNAWVGVTATDSGMFQAATMWLEQVRAKVKYVSVEPFINHVEPYGLCMLNWLILGGLSGAGTYAPYVPDVELLLQTADLFHLPVFIKRNLDWPVERQEWPKSTDTR